MPDDPTPPKAAAQQSSAPDAVGGKSIELPEAEGPMPDLARPPEPRRPFDPRVVIPLDLLDPPMASSRERDEKRAAKRLARRQLITRIATEAAIGLAAGAVGIGIYEYVQHGKNKTAVFDEGVVVAVSSEPAGAAIFIDGRDTGEVTPSRLKNWDISFPHHVRLELKGYFPDDQLLQASPRPPDILATLPRIAHLAVRSEPPGAALFFDGRAVEGRTPTTFDVPAGRDVELQAKLDGYLPVTRHVLLQPDQTELQELKLAAMAILAIRTEPPGVRCTLDDQPPVATPADFNVPAGVEHHIQLLAIGLAPQEKKVTLAEGKRQELKFRFEDPKDRRLRAKIDTLNRQATFSQRRLESMDGKGGSNDMFATFGRLNRQDKLSDAIDQADSQAQELSDQLSQDQLELEDWLKAENLKNSIPAGAVFAQKPVDDGE